MGRRLVLRADKNGARFVRVRVAVFILIASLPSVIQNAPAMRIFT
jgi:hypothetical protein